MEFFGFLDELKNKYNDDCVERKNGTMLLGLNEIPKSRHTLFVPLNDELILSDLVSQYANKFPKEYIDFLKYSNGANLYTVRIKTKKHSFAHSLFVIFGLPQTEPFMRPLDMEEPYDMRIEDLSRHSDISENWLKCGTYNKNCDIRVQYDIFIDTVTNNVFACEKNQKDIIDRWNSLDECFCNIFKSFDNSMDEYEYISKYE